MPRLPVVTVLLITLFLSGCSTHRPAGPTPLGDPGGKVDILVDSGTHRVTRWLDDHPITRNVLGAVVVTGLVVGVAALVLWCCVQSGELSFGDE